MQAAGRGDFQEVLANFQPAIVKLHQGLLTHKVTTGTTLKFNIAGWHRSFNYESSQSVVVNTEQQIRNSGGGVLTVFTNTDMTADSQRRKSGSKGEEAVHSNFLLRFATESKLSDSNFDEKTRLYALEVITGMSAQYSVTFTSSNTTSAQLDDYLLFAKQLGLDTVGATRDGLAPLLELKNGSFGNTSSNYEVRYVKEAIERLIELKATDSDIKLILRRLILANFFSHPTLHDVGWLYGSDDVRALVAENGNNFVNAETILGNAQVSLTSPIPGVVPPATFANNFMIRNDVAILFGIEDKILRAFRDLMKILSDTTKIKAADLEKRLQSFGDALQAFDGFAMGENSVFAVFDGLIQLNTEVGKARASSLTFTSTKDGADRTKVFTLGAVAGAAAAIGSGSNS